MKNIKIIFFSVILFALILIPTSIEAASKHGLGLRAFKCPMDSYASESGDDKYYACLEDYLDTGLPTYVVSDGSNVDPGTVLLLVVDYYLGPNEEVVALNTLINYDTSVWSADLSEDSDLISDFESTNYPKAGRKVTWSFSANIKSPGVISVLAADTDNYKELPDDIELGYIFVKMKDDAQPGKTTSFNFSTAGAKMSDADNHSLPYDVYNLNLSVYGAESHDATLSSLTVKNGNTTYPLNSTFEPNTFTYSTVVPANVSQITLNATPHDEKGTVTPGTIGLKNLQTGANLFTISVASEFGNIENYTIEIYRLSDDATLKSLTTTNNVDIGTFASNTTLYETDVLYHISNTTITAEATHPLATIFSGDGNWTFINSKNETLNTRNIIVKAEDCAAEYNSVPGNNCTSKTYTIKVTRHAASTDNNLASLKVDGTLVSNFDPATLTYTLPNAANSKSTMNIAAEVADVITLEDGITKYQRSKIISGTGNVNLAIGDNSYNIVVEAESGARKTYTINVHRLSNDTSLQSLSVTSNPQGTLATDIGNPNSHTYTYDPTVTQINVSAVVNDTNKAMIAIADVSTNPSATGTPTQNSASGTYSVTTTKVMITVTAEDGTIKNYPVNLTRLKSSNNYLSSLSLSDGTLSPNFVSTTRTYSASVDGSVENVTVNAVPAVEYASIKSITGNTNLQFGNNPIEVVVKAENGDEASYIINLERKKYTIATLDSLTVDGTSVPNFNKNTFEYRLPDVEFTKTSVDVAMTKTNSYSTVTGTGTINLKTGENQIKVKVVSHDGKTTNEYVIKIYRAKNSDNSVHGLTVSGVVPTLKSGTDDTYEVTLPNSKKVLNPSDVIVSISDDATIDKDNSINLVTENVNTYKFRITNENGDEKEYTILVTREPSNDTSISKVTLSIGNDSSRYCLIEGTSCTISVPVETTEFKLSSIIHEKARISPVNGTSYSMPASESIKSLPFIVTAEDGTIKNYTVVVERQKSSNNNLATLVVKNGTTTYDLSPNFSSNQLTYNVTVPGLTDNVTVEATVEDTGKASITTDLSEPFSLQFGSNKIEVTVKAENNQEKTYTIFVTRSKGIDATLKDLTINGTTIQGFDPTITSYILNDVDYNTHQLNILATPNDTLASKSGDGLISIKTGDNTIVITVTAHDTSVTKPYEIKVNRGLNSNTHIKGMSLAGVPATCDFDNNKCTVTVPNNVSEANTSNLVVTVADPAASGDKLATASFVKTDLDTTQTTDVNITITAEDGTLGFYTLEVTREKSNVATLDSLTVTNGAFNPSFNTNKFVYNVTVPVNTTEFEVEGVLTEEHAVVTSGLGHYTMASNESEKTVEIVILSQDLSVTKTYTLNISRTKSSVNTLKELTVSEGTLTPEFDPDTTSYSVNVGGSVDTINVGAEVTDNSRATIISGLGDHNLNVGANQITVRVKSESGANRDYVITVNRAPKENNNLASLTVDNILVANFDPDTLEYTINSVAYSKTSIEIGATTEDSDATVTGTGRKGLKTGDNSFDIVVKAQNGNEKTYKINIFRAKNNNAYLRSLSVSGYAISFDKEQFEYEITVDENKEKLLISEVTAVKEDANATLVEPSEDLVLSTDVANYYQINVTSEDGSLTNTYTITVNRPKSSDTKLLSVTTNNTATISPAFNKNRESKDYTLTVPYGQETFTIDAVPNNIKTQVFNTGTYPSTTSLVTLTTLAEDGSVDTYQFYVTQAPSNDATLSDLAIGGYALDKTFEPTTLNYSIGNVPYGTSKLVVDAVTTNSNSTIEYYVDSIKQDIDPNGENIEVNIPQDLESHTIKVIVTAPDRTTKRTYNITLMNTALDNAYLTNIIPSVGTLEFNKPTTYYEVNVANDVTAIDFNIIAEDSNASIKVGSKSAFGQLNVTVNNLIVGNNQVNILVTAQNEVNNKTYTVVVKRQAPVLSDDANLSSLSVDGYPLTTPFDMDTLEYSIGTIPYGVTSLTVNAVLNLGSSTIKYSVNGVGQSSNVVTIPKVVGNGAINVQVTAEDGTTKKNYKITYTKAAPSDDATLSNILVSEGTLSFNPDTYTYTVDVDSSVNSIDVTAMVNDNNAKMQMNGVAYTSPNTITLSPLVDGDSNRVIIVVTAENGNVLTYSVTINKQASAAPIPEVITSYQYGHTIDDTYIKTVALDKTAGVLKQDELDNDAIYLQIWSADETTQIGDNEKLATGMIVKLIINGVEKDRKIIVIRGDTSGDGEVDLFDAVKILNNVLGYQFLSGAYEQAGYVNEDEDIDLYDSVKILNHVLGREFITY